MKANPQTPRLFTLVLLALSLQLIQARKEICRVHAVGFLLGNDEEITGDAETFECNLMTEEGESEDYILIDSFSDDVFQEEAMWKGEWYIEYKTQWLVTRHPDQPPQLDDPENKPINTLTLDEVWDRLAPTRARRRSLQEGHWKRRLGERSVTDQNRGKMILVRVSTSDAEPRYDVDHIYNSFFGENSFHSQMKACSFGQMDLSPYDEAEPVLEVTVPLSTAEYSFNGIFGAAEVFVREHYGVASSHELAEFVAMSAPSGLGGPNGRAAVAAAGYDSWKSVFTDSWAGRPMVSIHEIGHNLNIGHAWKDDNAYGDRSSVMGAVSLNTVSNCYNGLAYDFLGWMDDKVVEIDHTADGPHSVNLAFFGEYDLTFRKHVTVIKSAGYYIYYNLKRGINADVIGDPDSVLLHRYRVDGAPAAGSILSTWLHGQSRPNFEDPELDFAIRICRTATGRPNDDESPWPGFVQLEIGTVAQQDSLCQEKAEAPVPTAGPTHEPTLAMVEPTKAPSVQPTHRPTPEPTPRPTRKPSPRPTRVPSYIPTVAPSDVPSDKPSDMPSDAPSDTPSEMPSDVPTSVPSSHTVDLEARSSSTRARTTAPTLVPTNAQTDTTAVGKATAADEEVLKASKAHRFFGRMGPLAALTLALVVVM